MSSDGEPFRGQCKWFNVYKGYGFIERPNAEDVFVHNTSIKHSKYRVLYTGEPVEFRTRISGTGRLEACNVTGPGGTECSGSLLPKTARKHRCYNCGKFAGHLSRECPLPRAIQQRCYNCQSAEHRRSQCPQQQQDDEPVLSTETPNPSDSGIDLDTSTDSSVLSGQKKPIDRCDDPDVCSPKDAH